MKTKKILIACIVAAVATVSAINVSLSMKSDKQQLSDLQLANVEALAQAGENDEATTLWIRDDEDCEYTVSGAVGSTVVIFGAKIKIGASGTATYTYKNGRTFCTAGGSEQCMARYCPPLL